MAITITDPKLIEQLRAAGEEVVFTDADGKVIAQFGKEYPFAPPPEMLDRMMTEEQLAASRAKGPGRPAREVMAEMWKRLECTQ
jgi:hypothetical protein